LGDVSFGLVGLFFFFFVFISFVVGAIFLAAFGHVVFGRRNPVSFCGTVSTFRLKENK
jgi:hypothetical protein